MNVLEHPHVIVFPQLRNALIECICDEPTTFRYGRKTDVYRTNLASSAASPSLFGSPLTVASVVLGIIDVAVQMNTRKGDRPKIFPQ